MLLIFGMLCDFVFVVIMELVIDDEEEVFFVVVRVLLS